MNIHTEPEDGKNPVLEIIRESQKFLHLNYYLIDDPEFMKAIEDRVSHKVNVQIIIDGEPALKHSEGQAHRLIFLLQDLIILTFLIMRNTCTMKRGS